MHLGNITKLLCEEHSALLHVTAVSQSVIWQKNAPRALIRYCKQTQPSARRPAPSAVFLIKYLCPVIHSVPTPFLQDTTACFNHTHSHIHTNTHFPVINQEYVCVCGLQMVLLLYFSLIWETHKSSVPQHFLLKLCSCVLCYVFCKNSLTRGCRFDFGIGGDITADNKH